MSEININTIETILKETLEYSRKRDYVGWDKHDGMSSRIRRGLPFEHKWTNLVFQETIKRAPINLRPLFLVEQRPNPKGLSLFAMANLKAYTLFGCDHYLTESQTLCERILSHNLDDINGFCLSHHHELQGLSDKNPIRTPNIVSTSFGVKALLRTHKISEKHAEVARKSANFITSELLPDDRKQIRISYTPGKSDSYTLNANALAARLFVDLYDHFGDDEYREIATEILTYVANCQEEIGGWEYKDPSSASHLGMDNYHNGFIIESFLRYQEVVDTDAFVETVESGLNFYRHILYENDGAPCWDETTAYPRDIHAAAQGIIVFTQADNLDFAKQIIKWVIENLYANKGKFYYQKQKYYTKRFTLMRWCQAWMAYSLSKYLIKSNKIEKRRYQHD